MGVRPTFHLAVFLCAVSVYVCTAQEPSPTETPADIALNTTSAVFDGFGNSTTFGRALFTAGTAGTRVLSLTSTTRNQRGAALLDLPAMYYPTFRFRTFILGGSGGDGIAFSYGANIAQNLTAAMDRAVPVAMGFGDNLIVVFKSATNNQGPSGISVYLGGVSSIPAATASVTVRRAWMMVTVSLSPSTVLLDGTRTGLRVSVAVDSTWVIANVTWSGVYAPTAAWLYTFSASTMNGTDNQRVDNFTAALELPPDVTITVVYTDDPTAPLDIWVTATLEAAILTARGPSFSVKAGRVVYRSGTPRGRRLSQLTTSSSATSSTVQVSLDFYNSPLVSADVLALRVGAAICSGSFATAARQQLAGSYAQWNQSVPTFQQATYDARMFKLTSNSVCGFVTCFKTLINSSSATLMLNGAVSLWNTMHKFIPPP